MKTRSSDSVLLLLSLLLFFFSLDVVAQPAEKITPDQWHQLNEDKSLNYKNDKEPVSTHDAANQSGLNSEPAKKITPIQWRQLKEDKALNYKSEKELVSPQVDYNQGGVQKAIMKFISFLMGPAGAVIMWLFVIGLVIFIIGIGT